MRKYLASIFFQHLAIGFTIPVLILWQRQSGLSFIEIGIIQSVGLITAFLFDAPSSYFADRFGKKLQIVTGLICLCGSFGLLIFSHSFLQFLLADMVQKIGFAMLSGTEESFLHDLHGKNDTSLTKLLGRMSIVDEAGTIFGLGLSSVLAGFFGIPFTFIIGFFCLCTSLLLVVTLYAKNTSTTLEVQKHQFAQFLSMPRQMIFMVCALLVFNAFISERGEMVFQSSLQNVGWQLSSFGFIYMFAKIFSILGSSMSHKVEGTFGIQWTICLTILLQCIAFSMLFISSKVSIILALSLFFFSENVVRNVRASYVLRSVPPSLKTTALSLVGVSSSFVLSVIQPFIGFLTASHIMQAVIFIIIIKTLSLFWFASRRSFTPRIRVHQRSLTDVENW